MKSAGRLPKAVTIDIRDSKAVVSRLWTALQAVADPATYVGTGEPDLGRHRAALAERAKAMTGLMLFMLEGLVEARVRFRERGICHVPSMVHEAWLRYLQLHGRQGAVVVPMDGWLVSELPIALLTKDEQVLGVLASTVVLGDAHQTVSDIRFPPEMLLPAQMFGELIESPDLASELASLLGCAQSAPFRLEPKGASSSVAHSPVARQLIQDFAAALLHHGFPWSNNPADRPEHRSG